MTQKGSPEVSTDVFTPAERSAVMRAVPGKHSSAELKVRKLLTRMGLRYRLHRADLPGSPDVVMPRRKLAIFVHGCFWHQHDCKRGNRQPSSRREYWDKKLAANLRRDREHRAALEQAGWQVLVIWECETKDLEELAERLRAFLL